MKQKKPVMLIRASIKMLALIVLTSFSGDNKIPIDPNIQMGKLENGLTYYIVPNEKPENRVMLRLAVAAGSVQEDDDQLGMAHFVEHMCFNGTENFPKNELTQYLQSVGVNFGPDINGYTSFNETVYKLTLPSDSASILNNGFKIMADWAHNVTFDTAEIRKERGVILEEWRGGLGANQRMRDKYLPVLLNGSKYSERLPIGTKKSIENTPSESIIRFYKDWYRPGLMALIVVGDIDPDRIEKKIKEAFGNIPKTDNPRSKEAYKIPDNNEPLISIVSDKENGRVSLSISYKKDADDVETLDDLKDAISRNIFCSMLNRRLNEISRQADPPFLSAGVSYGRLWVKTCEGFQVSLSVDEGKLERGVKAVMAEIERVKQHGFIQPELERVKKNMLTSLENAYKEKDKMESASLVSRCVNHFLNNSPIPSIEFQYKFINKNIDDFTLENINKLPEQFITENNQVIVYKGIEKDGAALPSEDDIFGYLASVTETEIEPYKENELPDNLLENIPEAGKIITEKEIGTRNVTEIELSNGATVVLKPTDFKNDQIQMRAFSKKGSSIYPAAYKLSYSLATVVVSQSGAGQFSGIDINKILSGKRLGLNANISSHSSTINANSSVADFETLLQLGYLYFTQPRFDEEIYNSIVQKTKANLKNYLSGPARYYSNEKIRILYNDHPLAPTFPTEDDWNNISLDKMKEVYTNHFSNAAEYTFIILGSFEPEKIKPLIETYLGGLPSTGESAEYFDNGLRPVQGPIDITIYKGTDPKSFVSIIFNGPAEWDKIESHAFWTLGNILQKVYTKKLREEMSDVYNIGINTELTPIPYDHFKFEVQIPCSPENAEQLTDAVLEEIERIQSEGPTKKEMQDEKESQRRNNENEEKDNGSWMFKLHRIYSMEYDDFGRIERPYELGEQMNRERIKDIANKYLDTSEYVRIMLFPEKNNQVRNSND